jgi:hypothetical protein
MRAMIEYRAYTVGFDGHFIGLKELMCADDREAAEIARRLIDGHDIELWCGDRVVIQIVREPEPCT